MSIVDHISSQDCQLTFEQYSEGWNLLLANVSWKMWSFTHLESVIRSIIFDHQMVISNGEDIAISCKQRSQVNCRTWRKKQTNNCSLLPEGIHLVQFSKINARKKIKGPCTSGGTLSECPITYFYCVPTQVIVVDLSWRIGYYQKCPTFNHTNSQEFKLSV